MQSKPGAPVPWPIRVRPERIEPLALFLADQDATVVTGQVVDTMKWSQEHGFGGTDEWT